MDIVDAKHAIGEIFYMHMGRTDKVILRGRFALKNVWILITYHMLYQRLP